MSERQSDSMRFTQDLDAHITRSNEQPPPVTFEELIRQMNAVVNDSGWSAKWAVDLEVLAQQVRALRDEVRKTIDCWNNHPSKCVCADLEHEEIATRLTALLGKPRG